MWITPLLIILVDINTVIVCTGERQLARVKKKKSLLSVLISSSSQRKCEISSTVSQNSSSSGRITMLVERIVKIQEHRMC